MFVELVSYIEVIFGGIFIILHNVFLSSVIVFQMVDFLFIIKVVRTFIDSYHPNGEEDEDDFDDEDVNCEHKNVSERILIFQNDAASSQSESTEENGGNAEVMNGGKPGWEFDVDSGFGEHFAEKYQAESVIGDHSNDESGSNGNVIDLSRGVDQRYQVLKEYKSENNVHYIIDH